MKSKELYQQIVPDSTLPFQEVAEQREGSVSSSSFLQELQSNYIDIRGGLFEKNDEQEG